MTGCLRSNCDLRHLLWRQLASVLTGFSTLWICYKAGVCFVGGGEGLRDLMNGSLMKSKCSFENVTAAPWLLVCAPSQRGGHLR